MQIAEIETKMADADYQQLLDLTALFEEKCSHRDALYEEWEQLSEFLEQA